MPASNRIMMLFSIVGRGKGKKYMDMLTAKGISFHMQMAAHGTAPSEMMDMVIPTRMSWSVMPRRKPVVPMWKSLPKMLAQVPDTEVL